MGSTDLTHDPQGHEDRADKLGAVLLGVKAVNEVE